MNFPKYGKNESGTVKVLFVFYLKKAKIKKQFVWFEKVNYGNAKINSVSMKHFF